MDYDVARVFLRKNIGKLIDFRGKQSLIGYRSIDAQKALFWGTPDEEEVKEYVISIDEKPKNYLEAQFKGELSHIRTITEDDLNYLAGILLGTGK